MRFVKITQQNWFWHNLKSRSLQSLKCLCFCIFSLISLKNWKYSSCEKGDISSFFTLKKHDFLKRSYRKDREGNFLSIFFSQYFVFLFQGIIFHIVCMFAHLLVSALKVCFNCKRTFSTFSSWGSYAFFDCKPLEKGSSCSLFVLYAYRKEAGIKPMVRPDYLHAHRSTIWVACAALGSWDSFCTCPCITYNHSLTLKDIWLHQPK